MSRCRHYARPAASRSAMVSACARPAGRNCRSLRSPTARLGIPFVYDPGPGLLSMEAIADPPAYDRARAAVRYDDIARALLRAGAAHVDVLVFARVVARLKTTI
jgi:predicted amidophosphoribosyltransferase